jgi:hypothetical protein
MAGLEDRMLALTTMSSAQLRDAWRALKASPVPLISPSMLRLALGYELQAQALVDSRVSVSSGSPSSGTPRP